MRKFREDRAALLADWTRPQAPRPKKAKASAVELRAARAAKNLAAWQRKQKLANTKIKKYKRQCAYYEKKSGTAAKREGGE